MVTKKQEITHIDKIASHIRDNIRSGGIYLPGSRLPTLRELAKEFNVSHCTVEGALRIVIDEGWVERLKNRGFRTVARPPHRVIAFVSEEQGYGPPSEAEQLILSGVVQELHEAGFSYKLFSGHEADYKKLFQTILPFSEVLRLARNRLLGGVIIRGNSPDLNAHEKDFASLPGQISFPAVRIEGCSKWGESSVQIDFEAATQMQVDYLVKSRGCKKLALVACGKNKAQRTVATFKDSLHKLKLPYEAQHVTQIISYEDSTNINDHTRFERMCYEKFSEYLDNCLAKNDLPDGLVISDNIAAQVIAMILMAKNIKIPEQLKVCSHSNKESRIFIPLQFSYCQVDSRQLGALAAHNIIQQCQGDTSARNAQIQMRPYLITTN